jgi:hypothetical protein
MQRPIKLSEEELSAIYAAVTPIDVERRTAAS